MNATKDTQNGQKEPKDRLAFDKTDRISLLVLMGVIGAIVVARTVILPIAGWIAGDPIVLPFLSPINVPQLDAAGVDYTLGTYGVQLADPSTYQVQGSGDSGAGALKAMNERVSAIEEELLGCLERWETLEARKG